MASLHREFSIESSPHGSSRPREAGALAVARRHWWVIVLTTAITVGVAIAGLSAITPSYQATATLQAQISTGVQTPVDPTYVDRVMNTYSKLVAEPGLRAQVARRLGVHTVPPLTVTVQPNTELLDLAANDPSPELAQRIANVAAAALIQRAGALAQGTSQASEQQLSNQLNALAAGLTAERLKLAQIPPTPDNAAARAALTQKISGDDASYQALIQQRAQLQLADAVRNQTLTVVQAAGRPTSPASPKRTPVLGLAIVLGLLGGFALAFVLERLAPRLYTVEAIESVAQADVLAAIPPSASKLARAPLVHAGAPAQEAFGVLAVHILAGAQDRRLCSILVTSRNPGDGKSTVASNLAAELARSGHRTLIVDGDLRMRSLADIFEVEEAPGLSNLLENPELDSLLDEFIVRPPGIPNLGVIPAGPERDAPARLLASDRLGALVSTLSASYEFVVFDAPPLGVSDPLSIARHVDLVLLVVGGDAATDRDIQVATRQLTTIGAKEVSVVVNRWRSRDAASTYAYRSTV